MDLESLIRDVPDFPKKGIIFKDITPLLASPEGMRQAVSEMAQPYADVGVQCVVGIESRGFVFGSLLAQRLNAGFVPVRKPGKLPWKTVSRKYELEYGSNTVEMHIDAIAPGAKVLMADDLLATGGTMAAACEMVTELSGQIVGVTFVIELCFLSGRDKLKGLDVRSLIKVQGE
ncbi:MAG TPA: adenine phosphoribosyltransferase [Phycisphaerae bacterium]|nr:adenine phosphoribosyltransferase [Phycisphaerae bacterium]